MNYGVSFILPFHTCSIHTLFHVTSPRSIRNDTLPFLWIWFDEPQAIIPLKFFCILYRIIARNETKKRRPHQLLPFSAFLPALSAPLRSFPLRSFLLLHKAKEEDRHFSVLLPPLLRSSTSSSTSIHILSSISTIYSTPYTELLNCTSPIANCILPENNVTGSNFFPNPPIPARQSDSEPLSTAHLCLRQDHAGDRLNFSFDDNSAENYLYVLHRIASDRTSRYTVYCISLFAAIVHSSNNKFIRSAGSRR